MSTQAVLRKTILNFTKNERDSNINMSGTVDKLMSALRELFNIPRKLTAVKITMKEFSEKHLPLKTALKYWSTEVFNSRFSNQTKQNETNVSLQERANT